MPRISSYRIILLLAPLLGFISSFAQQESKKQNVLLHPDRFYKKYLPHLKIKRNPPDSLFIKTYPNYLSTGVNIFAPDLRINLSTKQSKPAGFDPNSKFKTDIANVVGLYGTYRFITAGFAFLVKPGINSSSNFTPSHYRTATIRYNSSAYALQFKYIRTKGFTDTNQPDQTDATHQYRQRPDIVNKEFQFEGVYNVSWKKYSYIGPLTLSQEQLKSRAGFLIKGGVYYNKLSGDSTLLTNRQKQYYDNLSNSNGIRSLSLRIAPGVGGNVVFYKHIYLAAALFTSMDFYFYKYLQNNGAASTGRTALAFVLDGKISLGYQSAHLYGGIRYETERRTSMLHAMDMNTIYSYPGFEFVYRFNAPKFIKRFYKKTMPPGM